MTFVCLALLSGFSELMKQATHKQRDFWTFSIQSPLLCYWQINPVWIRKKTRTVMQIYVTVNTAETRNASYTKKSVFVATIVLFKYYLTLHKLI